MEKETKGTGLEATATAAVAVAVADDVVVEKEATLVLEAEAPEEAEAEKSDLGKIEESVSSFKEESNKVEDLVDPEKKALDELKLLIREALDKHEFTPPPPPPPPEEAEEEKKEEEPKAEEGEEKKEEEPKSESAEVSSPRLVAETGKEDVAAAAEKVEETPAPEAVEAKSEEKVETVEEIKETIVHEVAASAPPAEEDQKESNEEEPTPPLPPEEVSIWGVTLLNDEKSDVILLKFLRARDFKVREAFAMLKSVVAWRKDFKIEELLEEEVPIEGLENVVYLHGVDKDGHPVSYNAFGEFQGKALYSKAFSDSEKRAKFLKWYIQFLEKNIRKLDFTPEGVSTILQIIDLKNSPGLILFKKELRQSTNQALQLLQDNYPEFVAKQILVNVPWWYVAYNRLISPFLTQRTKSKFVFAGPTKTAETLFKYVAPEQLPVQYGGLDKKGEQEFTPSEPATEEVIKPTSKHTVEFPVTEVGTLVWELRVVGWDVSYGVEFVPSAEGSYTWIVQKPRKIGQNDEQQLVESSFKITETGKVVVTFDNQTSRKKKVLYRFKAKSS